MGIAAALGVSAGAAADTTGPVFHPPQQYYLALGDSLAFGFHEAQFETEVGTGTYDPATFSDGYDRQLFGMMQPTAPPGQQPVTEANYACPGETTSSMIGGSSTITSPYFPCFFHYAGQLALHDTYPDTDSQLQAAVAFLSAHRGQVNPVTLDIGANDLLNLLNCDTTVDPNCVLDGLPGTISTMTANLNTILTALQNAEPSAEILVMNVPDPYAAYPPLSAASIQVFGAFDSQLDAVVAAHQDRLIDAFSSGLQLAQFNPAAWCEDIVVTSCGGLAEDVHPTAEGYQDMAELFFSAAGYTALPTH